MDNWISELKNNLAREFENRPRVATLATVRNSIAGPRADARSIIVRDMLDDGTLILTSDARSEKNSQLQSNPSATVVFWLPKLRWQCIVDSQATILESDSSNTRRLQQWRAMSNATRAMFTWPAPGTAFDPSVSFAADVEAATQPPESFAILILNPLAIETLDLNAHPHRRVMWIHTDSGWTSQAVNP